MARGALCLVAAFAVSPAVSATAAPHPDVDPESPAGVEYQLPLDRAREETAAGGRRGRDGGDDQPAAGAAPKLFGAGVSRAASGNEAESGGTGARSRRGEARGGGATDSPQSGELVASTGGGDATGPTAAIILGVLALGCALGFGLRAALRRPRP